MAEKITSTMKTWNRKTIAIVLAVVIILMIIPISVIAEENRTIQFAGGDGSNENPYLIATSEQLDLIRYYCGTYNCFKLIEDIDLSGMNWTPISDFKINSSIDSPSLFMGVFDGNNHTISNLTINSSDDIYVGLFGYSSGIIKNVNITEVSINVSPSSAMSSYVANLDELSHIYEYPSIGVVAGISERQISNVSVEGDMRIQMTSRCYIGGIVGLGAVEKSISNLDMNISTSSNYKIAYCGGICGSQLTQGRSSLMGYQDISFCVNNSNIEMTSIPFLYCGGICGHLSRYPINNCINYGALKTKVVGTDSVSIRSDDGDTGGLVGYMSSSTLSDSYNFGDIDVEAWGSFTHGGEIYRRTCGAGGIVGFLQSGNLLDNYNYSNKISAYYTPNSIGRIFGESGAGTITCRNYSSNDTLLNKSDPNNYYVPKSDMSASEKNGVDVLRDVSLKERDAHIKKILKAVPQISYEKKLKKEFDSHVYQLFDDELTWEKAKVKCEELGGHLVTIGSQAEQDFVETLIENSSKDCLFIGATIDNGISKWVTDEEFSYTNWNEGEPNNTHGQETVLMLYSHSPKGKWNDTMPNGEGFGEYDISNFGFICEWEPKGSTSDQDENINVDSSFDLDMFKANLYFKEGNNPVTNGVSGYYDSINHLHSNNLTSPWLSEIESDLLTKSLIESWDDLNTLLSLDPSKELEAVIKVQDYATAILLKIMECDFTTKKIEASRNDNYKNSKKAISSTSKMLKATGKADAWDNFDWGNIEKYKLSNLSDEQKKELEKAIKKNTEISGSIADAIKNIDYVTTGVETIGDLIYKTVDYCSACEMAEDSFAVLRQMRGHVTYPLLATALDKILASEKDYLAAVSMAFINTSVSAGLKVWQACYGKALTEFAEACGAEVAAVIAAFKIGQASGKLLCDTCFCTSKITEQYYKMKIIDSAENALYDAINELGDKYVANMNSENAKIYNESVGLYYNLYDLSADYAKQFSKYALSDGVLGNRGKAKDKYPQFETVISNTQETAAKIYDYSNGKWLTWLLVANYPDLFGGVDPINLYSPVLLDIIEKLDSGDWDYTEILTDNQSLNCDNVGFSFEDLDGDGISELLVTPIPNRESEVYDLFTIKDGKVKHLFSGWTRNTYILQKDDSFVNYSSGGANVGARSRYIVADGGLYCLDGVSWKDDYYYSNQQGFRDSLREEWDISEPIDESSAEEYLEKYSLEKIERKELTNVHSLNRHIVLESEKIQMIEGEFIIQNAVSLLDGYSDYDLVWKSNDENVISATAPGILMANNAGKTQVIVSTKDGKYSATLNVVVTSPNSTQTDKTNEDSEPNTDSTTITKPNNANTPLNGLVKGFDGKWAMYKDGKVDTSYSGIAKNKNGWWRVKNGYVDFEANGIYQNENGWWKTTNGRVTFNETGIFKNENGWWRVVNSKVDFNANGIYQNENGWWKVTNGKVSFNETGVFKNEYGWWRVVNSKVDFNANGIYRNEYGWWKTTNGKVTFNENGVFRNEYGWWKVKNSKVDFDFTGIAKNQYGSWYIKNGKVDFSKNGKIQYNSKTYTVKNGKVQ